MVGTSSGKSDWSSTATTWSPAPMAKSISVAVGDSDTMRSGASPCRRGVAGRRSSRSSWALPVSAVSSSSPQAATSRPAAASTTTRDSGGRTVIPPVGRGVDHARRQGRLPCEPRLSSGLVRHAAGQATWLAPADRRLTVAGQRRNRTGFADRGRRRQPTTTPPPSELGAATRTIGNYLPPVRCLRTEAATAAPPISAAARARDTSRDSAVARAMSAAAGAAPSPRYGRVLDAVAVVGRPAEAEPEGGGEGGLGHAGVRRGVGGRVPTDDAPDVAARDGRTAATRSAVAPGRDARPGVVEAGARPTEVARTGRSDGRPSSRGSRPPCAHRRPPARRRPPRGRARRRRRRCSRRPTRRRRGRCHRRRAPKGRARRAWEGRRGRRRGRRRSRWPAISSATSPSIRPATQAAVAAVVLRTALPPRPRGRRPRRRERSRPLGSAGRSSPRADRGPGRGGRPGGRPATAARRRSDRRRCRRPRRQAGGRAKASGCASPRGRRQHQADGLADHARGPEDVAGDARRVAAARGARPPSPQRRARRWRRRPGLLRAAHSATAGTTTPPGEGRPANAVASPPPT